MHYEKFAKPAQIFFSPKVWPWEAKMVTVEMPLRFPGNRIDVFWNAIGGVQRCERREVLAIHLWKGLRSARVARSRCESLFGSVMSDAG
jgi:hypothetical protein